MLFHKFRFKVKFPVMDAKPMFSQYIYEFTFISSSSNMTNHHFIAGTLPTGGHHDSFVLVGQLTPRPCLKHYHSHRDHGAIHIVESLEWRWRMNSFSTTVSTGSSIFCHIVTFNTLMVNHTRIINESYFYRVYLP